MHLVRKYFRVELGIHNLNSIKIYSTQITIMTRQLRHGLKIISTILPSLAFLHSFVVKSEFSGDVSRTSSTPN